MRWVLWKKQAIIRGILGFPQGIAFMVIGTIIGALFYGEGSYALVHPDLVKIIGNEINAVILQTVSCGLIGSVFASSSVIWQSGN